MIVNSTGVDELAAQTEYLDRIHGMDEAVVDRVRELRNEVRQIVAGRRAAAPASTTAAGSPPVTPTRAHSPSPPASRSSREG